MSFEEIYDDLYENATKIDIDDLLEQLLDEHLDGDEGDDSDGGGEESDKEGKKPGKGKPKLSEEERKKIRDEMKEAILGAAHAAGAGNVPAGVKRMIQDLTEPKIDWRELLQQQIQSTIKSDFSWQRPNRKAWHTNAILPGMINEETIDICIALDMSGSITGAMGKDMLSEVQGIMDQYTDYRILVWCFDTAVYNPQQFTADCGELLTDYEIKGGGGTDFMCNWDWMKAEDINPKKFIMFTDGYPYGSWGDENFCDTVFIIHGTETIEPPFGTWAYYTKEAKR
jgi:predicted metal-dependent peptidase